jgi:SAM-dependent methyltransferase
VNAAEVFEALHRGLPQQGPGSDASTFRALSMLPGLPAQPEILDVGCGPGRQTLALLRATGGRVTAVDTHAPFLTELERRARAEGVSERVTTLCCSLDALPLPDAGFDLVWSEGALYSVGFDAALRALRRLLRPGAPLAATELAWLVPDPPREAREFWRDAYPGMRGPDEIRRAIAAAGYAPAGDFALPGSDWWGGYYAELEPRIAALRESCRGDAAAQRALDAAAREIELLRACPGAYGYVFFLMRRAG